MLSAVNISEGKIHFGNHRLIDDREFEREDRRTRVRPGDVLLTIVGTIGRAAVVPLDCPPFTLQRSVAVIKPAEINSRFVRYMLESPRTADYLNAEAKGTAQKGVYLGALAKVPIVIPPLNEQDHIVEKIEILFARINKGEEALREVLKLLNRYRQSILKAAVTGELTRDWREANQHRLEPASELLASILETRRENWQGRGKFKEPVLPDIINLPKLPDSWLWTSLDSLLKEFVTGPFGSALHKSDYVENGIPLVNPINIVDGMIIPDGKKGIDEGTLARLRRFALELGDVVIARRGDMGRCAAVTSNEKNWLCGTGSMILRPTPAVLPEFLSLAIRSSYVVSFLETNSIGTTMKNLNQRTLLAAPIPIPSLQEQQAAICTLEFEFGRIKTLVNACRAELGRSTALRRSILKSAFTGQLVPQDPNDEPASELLARIRAQADEKTAGRAKARKRT